MNKLTLIVAALLSLPGIFATARAQAAVPETVTSSAGEIKIEQLATLEYPWGMDLLPDGKVLITEKPGRLRLWNNGNLSEPIMGLPKIVHVSPKDQGGLLDVAIDPDFTNNKLIYLSYVEATEDPSKDLKATDDFRFPAVDLTDDILRGGAVARARFENNQLHDLKVIWRQLPKTVGRGHFGNRLLFASDGTLYITSGDRMRFEPAQSLSNSLGKVVRINPDGTIPKDNPFASKQGAHGEIWSYGHRNILAAAFEPHSGKLWAVEMGPLGGDELNLIEPGQNYGWPLVSNGEHYTRPNLPTAVTHIPDHAINKDFNAPVRSWTPVISPSGALFYTGDKFPEWGGNLLIGGLSSKALIRLKLEGGKIAVEERINLTLRIRDLLQAPDGTLLLLTDDKQGALLRLAPTQK